MSRFKIRTGIIGAMALLALGAISFTVRAADPLKLESIDVQTLSGQQVQLKLHMNGPAPEPLPFTIDKPARIAFDLPNTTLGLASRRIDVHSGGVDTVLAAEANGRTRLVVNVETLLPYTTKVDGDTITVTLGSQPGDAAKQTTMARAGAGQGAAAAERAIRTIDFRRGADGTGRVIVQLTDPRTPVNVRQEGNQIVVDFAGTLMPKNLMRRYDVMDFATPVQTVDALRVEGSSRLVISAQGDFEQLAYQSDNQYTIEIKPSLKRSAAADEKKEYTGERLTLNFQDIDVRSVLQLLADTSGQNIVVSDSVTGNLTLRLQNVPWDQALDIVLRTKGLDKRRQDNVIIIGPTEELASREKAELAAQVGQMQGQLEINKTEAASTSIFIAGWRPAVGWVCVIALGYAYVVQPFAEFVLATFKVAITGTLPHLDTGTLISGLLIPLLGLATLRTVEKVTNSEGNR